MEIDALHSPGSLTCFILASYSSQPYTSEVARSAWGHLHSELDPTTRSLLDATDPRSAAIIGYGLAACPDPSTDPNGHSHGDDGRETFEDAGLGRLLRMTRRTDLGLGEVLEAVRWYGEQKRASEGLERDHGLLSTDQEALTSTSIPIAPMS